TRLERKNQSQRVAVNAAMARLAEPLAVRAEKTELLLQRSDPLLDACRLVCQALGVTLLQTLHSGGEPRDACERLARSAWLRLRRVMLSGDWWREDNGPILGVMQETNGPVALLPNPPTSYCLPDPASQTRQVVT